LCGQLSHSSVLNSLDLLSKIVDGIRVLATMANFYIQLSNHHYFFHVLQGCKAYKNDILGVIIKCFAQYCNNLPSHNKKIIHVVIMVEP
jgi:hypothetical protein